MKAHLLFRDTDFDWSWVSEAARIREAERKGRKYRSLVKFDREAELPWNADALITDLGLNTLFRAMAKDDDEVFEVSRKVVLSAMSCDLDTVKYRQAILQDCIENPKVIRALYALAVEAIEIQGKHYLGSFMQQYPDTTLRWSIESLQDFVVVIEKLKKLATANAASFQSEGLRRFFSMIDNEIDNDYINSIKQHLKQLVFRDGLLLSAQLDKGNRGTNYHLHLFPQPSGAWITRLFKSLFPWAFRKKVPAFSFTIHPRDQAGFQALAGLRNRGIAIAATALGQATDHVSDFFHALRAELAFHVGCINLHERLERLGAPTCMPDLLREDDRKFSYHGLYDVALSLHLGKSVIGNDGNANGKDLIVVTGANQGGKSTYLRSVGLAQLMTQCGLFAPAVQFQSGICDALLTHYKREEDSSMESGKLDEELHRMSDIIDHMTPHPMILFNESFAATNEREGSEIARQVTSSLKQMKVRMVFVTHLYNFADSLYETRPKDVLFLRAAREKDGSRTFGIVKGKPLKTSYGADLYDSIFEAA